MRFLLYDRIKLIEKGRRIVGVKSFPLSEECMGRHFTRQALVPGVLLIEAMAQLVGWLIIYSHDFELASLLTAVDDVALPPRLPHGAIAEFHGEIVSSTRDGTLARGKVLVDGVEVASVGRIVFAHFAGFPKEELKQRFGYYGGFRADEVAAGPEPRPAAKPSPTPRRVVVTGLGLVTPLGIGTAKNWRRLLAGESAVRPIDILPGKDPPVRFAGQVSEEDWQRLEAAEPEEAARRGERRVLFALCAAAEAVDDAGLLASAPLGRTAGVSLAAGLGIVRLEDVLLGADEEGAFDPRLFARRLDGLRPESICLNPSDRPACLIAARYGLTGPSATTTSACAAANQAIGTAYRMIRRGDADVMIAGGADSMIHPVGSAFFVLLGAASTSRSGPEGVCCPFDRRRSGLVMGEGAGMVVLESEEHARGRGARIYAEVAGYGVSMDAHQVTAPHPQGRGAAAAMADALRDAGMKPEDIRYINAHGTATKLNDAAETLAIKQVFGAHARQLAISSTKSMIGHLLGACGAPEFACTVLSVYHGRVHPTINLTHPDPKCDLDYVAEGSRRLAVDAAMTNSFGFGGQNAVLIVRKCRATWDRS